MISTSLSSAASASSSLVRLADGEYTAASVAADPTASSRLDLVKLKDGNYAAMPVSPSLMTSASTAIALSTLHVGGT